MAIIKNVGGMVTGGVARAFRGARTGDQQALLTGAALAAFGLWRRSSSKKKELLYRKTVPMGSSLVVRYGDGDEVEVRRTDQRTR